MGKARAGNRLPISETIHHIFSVHTAALRGTAVFFYSTHYFYKYINMTKKKYEGDFFIPSIDIISKELKKATFPTFFLNTDFNNFIEQLEEKLLRLNQFSHKRIVWNVINIITKLKEYQKFCTQTRYSFISVIKGEQEQYNIYDTKNFFLKSMDDFSFDHKTVVVNVWVHLPF